MNQTQTYFGAGAYNGGGGAIAGKHVAGAMGAPDVPRDDSRTLIWEASRMLQDGFMTHGAEMPYLLELAHSLGRYLENTRVQYNRAISERTAAQRRLQEANVKLAEVEQLVKRYATVRDPVLASDGYTYERESIQKYLEECSSGNSKAYSQQTKEELTDLTVPNKSLYRLVSHLKEIRPVEVPPTAQRAPISLMQSSMPPRSVWDGEDVGGFMPVDVAAAGDRAPPQPVSAVGGGGRPAGPSAAGQALAAGLTAPASASANNNLNNTGGGGRGGGGRFGGDRMGGRGSAGVGAGGRMALHPCLRVYGFCNFMDDCTFANYPHEACLNHIKGKCRFGQNCKELHVDPREPRYQNTRSYANQHSHHHNAPAQSAQQTAGAGAGATGTAPAPLESQPKEKAAGANAAPSTEATTPATTDAKPAGEKSEAGKDKRAAAESKAGDAKAAGAPEATEGAEKKSGKD